ncbi:B4GALT4 (predicted), partial [Pycnogonum litorale]
MRIKRLLTCYRCSNNQIRKLSVLFLLFLCVPSMIFMTVMTNNTDGLAKNIMDFIFKIANEFSPIYIRRYEDPNLNSFNIVKKSSKLCPILSPYLMPGLHMQEIDNVLKSKLSWKEIEDMNPDVELGGHHEPKSCTARRNLAIVIPFRDREDNLKKFSTYIHNFLQRQQLNYTIFVVEQVDDYPFNRGALMNVGFVESRKVNNFTCYAMHDVDLLPENDKNMYICDQRNPVHLSVVMNSDNYW